MKTETIAAIATPPGRGGISIIKISGDLAFEAAGALFRSGSSSPLAEQSAGAVPVLSRKLRYGHIVRPGDGSILDEVLIAAMKGPKTYTGEDVVEINGHGGGAVTRAILDLVLDQGVRLAEPGEFTRRAFLNGRIDLTQAEAVGDLIHAETAKASEMAAALMDGALGRRLAEIKNAFLEVKAGMEAAIDFPEEVEETADAGAIAAGIENSIRTPLAEIIDGYEQGRVFREGLRLTVAGKPNVGKSSLMNRLVREDRVIVTPEPGTTRDLVRETLDIGGYPVILTDTAGIHPTDDPVEKIGVQKARSALSRSDLILFVVDGSETIDQRDRKIFNAIGDAAVILVVNKIDLVQRRNSPDLPQSWRNMKTVRLSAKTGEGIRRLETAIVQRIQNDGGAPSGSCIAPNLRQKIGLSRALDAAERLACGIREKRPVEILAIDAEAGLQSVNEVLGLRVCDEVLDAIFSRFCIGK